jgi:hypothetical protein
MKKRYKFFILAASLYLGCKVCPEGIENAFSLLLENNFFIPKESCVCTFKKTVPATGSGEGWIYGEDNNHYYTIDDILELMKENKFLKPSDFIQSYYILKKDPNSEILVNLDYAKIIKEELDEWSIVRNSQEEYYRNTEQIRIEFRKHGKEVKCRAERSRWLGGC